MADMHPLGAADIGPAEIGEVSGAEMAELLGSVWPTGQVPSRDLRRGR